MKSRSESFRPKSRNPRTGRSTGRAIISGIVFFCALGCIWVWKVSWNERLSSRVLELEKQENQLKTSAGYMRRELLSVSQYPKIVELAESRIGMTIPQSPPDTLWCDSPQPGVMLGSAALYKFYLKGVDL